MGSVLDLFNLFYLTRLLIKKVELLYGEGRTSNSNVDLLVCKESRKFAKMIHFSEISNLMKNRCK